MKDIQVRATPQVNQGCSVSLFSPVKLVRKGADSMSIGKNDIFTKRSEFFFSRKRLDFLLFCLGFLLVCNILFYTFPLQDDQCVALNPSKNISSGGWC